jgi:hypothetical protein
MKLDSGYGFNTEVVVVLVSEVHIYYPDIMELLQFNDFVLL